MPRFFRLVDWAFFPGTTAGLDEMLSEPIQGEFALPLG